MYQIEKSLKPRIGHFGKTCTLPLYKGWSRTTSSEGFVATETRSCAEGINQLFLINAFCIWHAHDGPARATFIER